MKKILINNLNLRQVFVLSVTIFALLIVAKYVQYRQMSLDNLESAYPDIVESNEATETEQDQIVDTTNDGVYTNYKYEFSFDYPSEVLVKQTGSNPVLWLSEDAESIHHLGKTDFWLELLIRDTVLTSEAEKKAYGGSYIESHKRHFEEIFKTNVNEYYGGDNGFLVISKSQQDGNRVVHYYYEAAGSREHSKSYTYLISSEDLPIIELRLVTGGDKSVIEQNKYILEDIIDNIQFNAI